MKNKLISMAACCLAACTMLFQACDEAWQPVVWLPAQCCFRLVMTAWIWNTRETWI